MMGWLLVLRTLAGRAMVSIARFVMRYPWQCLCLALLVWGVHQYSRAGRWQAWGETKAEQLQAEKAARAADRDEWTDRVKAANEARQEAIRTSREISRVSQEENEALAADNAGLRAHIAAGRLRPSGAQAYTVPAAGGAQDHGTAVPDGAPTGDTLVATSVADLEACDAWYVYGAGARDFIQRLIAGGLAEKSGSENGGTGGGMQ